MSVRIDGLDVVLTEFGRRAARAKPDAGQAVVKAAAKAAQYMRDTVPVDKGDVLRSISSDDSYESDGDKVWAEAGPVHFVGRFLNDGTVKMAPRPFVDMAAKRVAPEFVEMVRGIT